MCQIILKSMHLCTSYGLDKFGRPEKHMHIHQSEVLVTGETRMLTFLHTTDICRITALAQIQLEIENHNSGRNHIIV